MNSKNIFGDVSNFFIKFIIPTLKIIGKLIKDLALLIYKGLNHLLTDFRVHLKGYLILICVCFIVATFIFAYNFYRITLQTIKIAESIKHIEELNNLNYEQSRQVLLDFIFDTQVNRALQPIKYDEVPIFEGTGYNRYFSNNRYMLLIKNTSPLHYKGNINIRIGLSYFDTEQNDWFLRTIYYEIPRQLNLAIGDEIKIQITDDLKNSGVFPNRITDREQVKINVQVTSEDSFQPRVKINQRLSYF